MVLALEQDMGATRRYLVTHSKGSLFLPLREEDGTVPRIPVDRTGQNELYVTELRPDDTIYVEGEGSDIKLADVIGALRRMVPDYENDRANYIIGVSFIGDLSPDADRKPKPVYETTRLRYDLFHAVAKQAPNLFEPEELANLDNDIFRRLDFARPGEFTETELNEQRHGFSRETVARISAYVETKSKELFKQMGTPWTYKKGAIGSWLDGSVIHPTHGSRRPEKLEDAFWIAYALDSAGFEQRASGIVETAHKSADDPSKRGEDPYFRLVDAHRIFTNELMGLGNGKTGKSTGTGTHMPAGSKARVHKVLPVWFEAVKKELAPRIENRITEARIHSVNVVDIGSRGTAHNGASGTNGLPKKVILVDDANRDEIYSSIGAQEKPLRRPQRLVRDLGHSLEIVRSAYEKAVSMVVEDIFVHEKGGAVGGNASNTDLWGVINAGGEYRLTINLDLLRFLSPIDRYSAEFMIAYQHEWNRVSEAALKNRGFRRYLVRELEKGVPDFRMLKKKTLNPQECQTVPDEYPGVAGLADVYKGSVLLKELFSEKTFIKTITRGDRLADSFVTGRNSAAIAGVPPHERAFTGEMTGIIKQREIFARRLEAALSREIAALKKADEYIPQELTMFRKYPRSVFPAFDLFNKYGAERALLGEFLRRYAMDPWHVIGLYDNVALGLAGKVSETIRDVTNGAPTTIVLVDPLANMHHRFEFG